MLVKSFRNLLLPLLGLALSVALMASGAVLAFVHPSAAAPTVSASGALLSALSWTWVTVSQT